MCAGPLGLAVHSSQPCSLVLLPPITLQGMPAVLWRCTKKRVLWGLLSIRGTLWLKKKKTPENDFCTWQNHDTSPIALEATAPGSVWLQVGQTPRGQASINSTAKEKQELEPVCQKRFVTLIVFLNTFPSVVGDTWEAVILSACFLLVLRFAILGWWWGGSGVCCYGKFSLCSQYFEFLMNIFYSLLEIGEFSWGLHWS